MEKLIKEEYLKIKNKAVCDRERYISTTMSDELEPVSEELHDIAVRNMLGWKSFGAKDAAGIEERIPYSSEERTIYIANFMIPSDEKFIDVFRALNYDKAATARALNIDYGIILLKTYELQMYRDHIHGLICNTPVYDSQSSIRRSACLAELSTLPKGLLLSQRPEVLAQNGRSKQRPFVG